MAAIIAALSRTRRRSPRRNRNDLPLPGLSGSFGYGFPHIRCREAGQLSAPLGRAENLCESRGQREKAGADILRQLCSPIYSTSADDEPTGYNVRIGTIRQRDQFVPRAQIWCRSAQRWTTGLKDIPGEEREGGR
jgi:hypothetical protein